MLSREVFVLLEDVEGSPIVVDLNPGPAVIVLLLSVLVVGVAGVVLFTVGFMVEDIVAVAYFVFVAVFVISSFVEDAGIIYLVEVLDLVFVGVAVSSVLGEVVVVAGLVAFVVVGFCVMVIVGVVVVVYIAADVCVLDEVIVVVVAAVGDVSFLAKVTDVTVFLVVVGNVVMVVAAMVGVANIILSSKEKRKKKVVITYSR